MPSTPLTLIRSLMGMGKAAFYAQVDLDQPKAYSYAIEVMAANAVTADGQEGIASFLEKRKPVWQTN
jgi:enoyl-CoA hydratase/carnithine racemase